MATIEQIEINCNCNFNCRAISSQWRSQMIGNCIAMFEGAKHRGGVSPLHSTRNLLDHVGSGK